MFDTHSHINTEIFFSEREEILARANQVGVENILIPAIEPKDYDDLISFASSSQMLYFGLGVHPHNANQFNQDVEDYILSKANEKKFVAIGEIGLDYYYDFQPKKLQKEVFRKQIQLAKRLNKPIIVHNRETDLDTVSIIKDEQDGTLKGVFHCFSGDIDFMNKVLELGFNISFTGNVTFKKMDFIETIKQVPSDRYMIETDAPYITPVPYRGKRNEPSFVKFTAEKIAEIRSISIQQLVKETTETAMKLFKIAMIIIAAFTSISLYAQERTENGEVEYIEEERVNPYRKNIGIGLFGGTNTQINVITYENGDKQDKTTEGVSALGGTLSYGGIADFLLLTANYTYSLDTKVVDRAKESGDFDVSPTLYNFYSASAHWIVNPTSRINFFATTGFTFYNTTFNYKNTSGKIDYQPVTVSSSCFRSGIGIIGNIPIEGVGLFTITGEWRLDFQLSSSDGREYSQGKAVPVTFQPYYSIIMGTISWYPNLW
jgi:TatD DNase family protein